jgi:hypothetical protein
MGTYILYLAFFKVSSILIYPTKFSRCPQSDAISTSWPDVGSGENPIRGTWLENGFRSSTLRKIQVFLLSTKGFKTESLGSWVV